MVNSSYTYSVFGMAAYTFAIGGMLVWVPNYLFSTRGFDQARAGRSSGWSRWRRPWSACRPAAGSPTAWRSRSPRRCSSSRAWRCSARSRSSCWRCSRTPGRPIFAAIFLAEALMFVNTGPCNAIIANVVQPNLRAAAYAIAIFAVHFLGDIWSPSLIGKVADLFGDPATMASAFGRALSSIGAVPTQVAGAPPENIVAGLLVVVPALLLSGIVLLAGARYLPREMALMQAKLKAFGEPADSDVTTGTT